MKMKNDATTAADTTIPSVRLDVWLWAARFFRTRSLAKQAIEGGRVEVNDARAKPSRAVHAGDRIRIRRNDELWDIVIEAVSEQRGSASIAQMLYRETDESRTQREALREQRKLEGADLARPATKPGKRARRLIRALGDIDAF
jgi:ribosome-associated heat shock protein Hsp15